ncbi:hypothetical protein HRH25_11900 [Flavisolibacter sp. BT320]|nr:hypothetical protein [Flavisolibacter longurius]
MAKQTGPVKLTGTIDDLCFYEMEGGYFVRRKSSLSGKRFQKDSAFSGSRRSCSRFGAGNRLASVLYRSISKEKRVYSLFCFLKGKSILLLKEGKSLREAEVILRDYLVDFGLIEREKMKVSAKTKTGSSKPYTRSHAGCLFAPATAGSSQKQIPGLTLLHRLPSLPFYPSLSSPAGRTTFYLAFPLRGGSFWRSPPNRGHPHSDYTG